MSTPTRDALNPRITTLDPARAKRLVGAATALFAVGVALSIVAAVADRQRFAFSYLTGFVWLATVGLGAMFFVLIQHLTKAGWSVIPRRQLEWLTGLLPVSAALFLPVAFFSHDIYHHWMGPDAHADPLIQKKMAYLNPTFFFVRAAVFLAVWSGVSLWFWRTSRKQDETGDKELTLRMAARSAPSLILVGLTLTFAAFDWLMSLDPHWYSTIYGVQVFSGSAVSSLAALSLLTLALERKGILEGITTVEHRHDIGKLLFGFTVFWAYIGFSQYLIIWYGNIPEETVYFRERWEGPWKVVSLVLVFGHFVVPFIALISRTAKRSRFVLGAAAALILAMHYVDIYWLVMPTLGERGAEPSWIDLCGLIGPLGAGLLVIARRAAGGPLYPVGDPRLAESLQFQNT
jgi:hypothetical protein